MRIQRAAATTSPFFSKGLHIPDDDCGSTCTNEARAGYDRHIDVFINGPSAGINLLAGRPSILTNVDEQIVFIFNKSTNVRTFRRASEGSRAAAVSVSHAGRHSGQPGAGAGQ